MISPPDEGYFDWLYSQALARSRSPRRKYLNLAKHLFTKPFVWFVPNDDNRVEDGRYLRYEYLQERGIQVDDDWVDLDCSFLEMLVALARRAAEESLASEKEWFWIFLCNLDLDRFNDAIPYDDCLVDVEEALDQVIERTYEPDGSGGLFPLVHPEEDQRGVELWYQLNAYLLENPNI